MFTFVASSLRAVATMLVPCGILATLVLPRAHGEVGNAHLPREHGKAPALLVAEGLPFIIVRPSGRIAMASRSARRLFSLRPGAGANLLDVTAGSAAHGAVRRALASPFEREEYFCARFPGTRGELHLYRMESTPMAEEDSTGIVLRDVTHPADEQPGDAEARMVQAASSMAGPLSVLSGWLETASEQGATLSPSALRAMERQVARLKELSADLGGEQAGCPLLLDSFSLAPVVQRAADRLAPRMVETGSCLELNYSESPCMLRGEAYLCQQLVGELLGSMLSEAAARQLRLSAERRGEQLVIEISSDGPSLWQAVPEGERSRLELVQAAVRAQHGELEQESTGSHGARYRLSFPV